MNDDEQTPSKPARTPKQMEALARARAKAYEVRKANAERRAKEKEVDAKLVAEYKAMRMAELDARHKNLHHADEEVLQPLVEDEDPDPEEELVEERHVRVKKRPPVRRRVVVVEEDTDSESDGEDVTTVKIPKTRDEVLERVKASMFGF